MSILSLNSVSKSFGALKVTDDVSFDVAPGEALGIIGPNGAGKSTLFNLITGNIRADAGQIVLDGRDVTRDTPMQRVQAGVGRSFQIPQPFTHLSVYENLMVAAQFGGGHHGAEAGQFCMDILDRTGLADEAESASGGLSLLQRKRLELARAMAISPRLILLEGGTGTAKTAVLQHLQGQGQQVLDLEAMAQHRGSVLGGRPGGQPAQKMFESRIAMALAGMDAARPVFLEAESNKIGARIIPPMLWQAMLRAEHVRIQAPLRARADYLVENYSDLLADPALLIEKLEALAQFHGHAQVQAWQAMARAAQFQPLAEALIRQHYDPGYRRASRRAGAPRMVVELPGLSPQDLAQAAARIAGAVSPADSGSRPGL